MTTNLLSAWIVDDDITYQGFLSSFLMTTGFTARGFCSGEECLEFLHQKPDVIILDDNQGGASGGVDMLRRIKEMQPDIPVIYTAGMENISLCSAAFRNGSMDFIEKDCASLIRLKIRLDKIKKIKELRAKRKRIRLTWTLVILAACIATGLIMHFLVCHISINLRPVW